VSADLPAVASSSFGPGELARVGERFAQHRATPEVSADAYVRSRRIELGESVMSRRRIYLDKCYWIALRDAYLDRSTNAHDRKLLESLRMGVRRKRHLCPISEALFMELLKQQDVQTRLATAELIDELSEGVTIVPLSERMATEIAHFLYSKAGYSTHSLSSLVWSRLSYVLGIVHPVLEGASPSDQLVFQKSFFDYMWDVPLRTVVGLLGDPIPQPFDFDDLAKQMNEGNRIHADSITSFVQAYHAELFGLLSVAVSDARCTLREMATKRHGNEADRIVPDWSEQLTYEFLRAKIREVHVARAIPTLHVSALCHAAVRWDRKRKLKGNDLYDFRHAEAAISYCEVFLTEKPLQSLLQQKHLKLGIDFTCRIIADKVEAVSWASAEC
jgi:hypothetical protein